MRPIGFGLLSAMTVIVIATSPIAAQASSYDITTFSIPNGNLNITAINNAGQMAGTFYNNITYETVGYTHGNGQDSTFPIYYPSRFVSINNNGWITGTTTTGYIYNGFIRSPNGSITTFSVPSASVQQTFINDSGQVAGFFSSYNGHESGFLRNPNGSISTFSVSGATDTLVAGISNTGLIAGNAFANFQSEGYVRAVNGTISTFSLPNTTSTYVDAISNTGLIAGTATLNSGQDEGFIRQTNGNFTTFSLTGANQLSLSVEAINDSGQITGWASPLYGGYTESFVRNADGTIVYLALAGQDLYANAINDAGIVVGDVGDSGFMAKPSLVPLPAALPMFGAAMAGLAGLGLKRSKKSSS